MLQLTSDRLVGPLSDVSNKPFYVKGFNDLETVSIGFIGHTYAGKTQFIRTLTHALGGVFQESQNYSKRTVNDASYIFGQYGNGESQRILAIKLKSHAGHDIGYGDKGPKADENVIVLKYLKSSTFSKQLRLIEPILEKEGISFDESYALVTRVDSASDMTTRRRNMVLRRGFKEMYCIDNPKKRTYSIDDINPLNIDLILKVLEGRFPNLNLIHFTEGGVPEGLEGKLVNGMNQLKFSSIPKGGFVYDEDPIMNSIWQDMSEEDVLFD